MRSFEEEDRRFLAALGEQMRKQETDCQAAPRFWAILDTREVLTAVGREDYIKYYYDTETYTLEEALEFCRECDYKDVPTIEKDGVNDCAWWVESQQGWEALPMVKENFVVPGIFFITKEECRQHIRSNWYHYNNPRTYAMTIFRAPQIERIWEMIENIDWEAMGRE